MNVILIYSDTLRADFLGCYGNSWIHTPHLDRFSEQAVIFQRAHCASFPTIPNRNDVLTGRWTFTYKPWAPIGDEKVLLQQELGRAGWITALFADTPHPFSPGANYQTGFHVWELIRGQEGDRWKSSPPDIELPCSPDKLRNGEATTRRYLQNVAWRRSELDYFPARTMRAAAAWLEENHSKPFFLYVDTFDPHEPWDPPKHYLARYEPEGYSGEEVIYPRYDRWADFMSEAELKHCRNLYAGEVSLVDRWIGYLLERVADMGVMDETAIIITTDHGFYFGEHGYIGKSLIRKDLTQSLPLYPEVSRIPLMIRLPGGRDARRTSVLSQPVDLMPTILELLGIPVPGSAQGKSLVPVLKGSDELRPFAVSSPTLTYPSLEAPHPTNRATITTDEWAFIFGAQVDAASSGEKTEMVDSLSRTIDSLEGPPRPELYDLRTDPTCTENVISQNIEVARELQEAFVAFLREAGMREDHIPYYEKPLLNRV